MTLNEAQQLVEGPRAKAEKEQDVVGAAFKEVEVMEEGSTGRDDRSKDSGDGSEDGEDSDDNEPEMLDENGVD
ncbi:hypothetical protein H0H81_007541 [Sphagnurus paluster]|uniref:Uncharacterized protein n=1 Tax=Sphagnurus paluster TaxID=117069 RepID=A0A9P7GFE8_9AGAR|nr:hypothetical protein H0H81_007541 [Sphagnurus paluster]